MSPKDPSEQGWQELGRVESEGLAHARLQCHWAAQVLAAVGYTHREQADDDSQSNFGWVDGMQVLAGRLVESEPACFLSLTPATLTLALHEPGGEVEEDLALSSRTLEEARQWAAAAIARYQGGQPRALARPPYDLPPHGLGQGEAFEFAPVEAFQELARAFHDANLVMLDLRRATEGASVPRVWPHHFDMGQLVSLEEHGDPQRGRSIGIGWTPGDEASAEPYWYVNPHPAPESALPPVRVGRWHHEGWTGVELRRSEVLAAGDGAAQEALVRRYLEESVAVCRSILEG